MSFRDDQNLYMTASEQKEAEFARLRASHDRLLAAAKASIELADKNVIVFGGETFRTGECKEIYDQVVAAIAAAEELAP